MKSCIATLAPLFNMNRMVAEYTEQLYIPTFNRGVKLCKDDYSEALRVAHMVRDYRNNWHQIRIVSISAPTSQPVPVHAKVHVEAEVHLGEHLNPEDVKVQLCYGELTSAGDLIDTETIDMGHRQALADGNHKFTADFVPDHSGMCGFSVRVIPGEENLASPMIPGLITWDSIEVGPTEADDRPRAAAAQVSTAG